MTAGLLIISACVRRNVPLRIERSCVAAESMVEALDRLSLERKKPVTRAMAAELLGSDLEGGG